VAAVRALLAGPPPVAASEGGRAVGLAPHGVTAGGAAGGRPLLVMNKPHDMPLRTAHTGVASTLVTGNHFRGPRSMTAVALRSRGCASDGGRA
jgi:hypothetical protein